MSIKTKIYNQKAEERGSHELSDKIFGAKVNEGLIHQAVVAQMGNERQVLAHTKDRGEVRGGGKKPWKQKGTGRARAGSTRSPIWIGGGVTFGPLKTRNFSKKINKKMKQLALFGVLTDKLISNNFVILDKFEIAEYNTKKFNAILEKLETKLFDKVKKVKLDKKDESVLVENLENKQEVESKKPASEKLQRDKRSVLIIDNVKNEKLKKSASNLSGIEIINLENINILDLLKYRNLIITLDGVKNIEKQYK